MRPSEALDALFSRSDPDSADWTDGHGLDSALEDLGACSEQDWAVLEARLGQRGPRWRRCLAQALIPRQGAAARRLLIALGGDADVGVAFDATLALAFYCGVNEGPSGAFLDPSITHAGLLAEARATPELVDRLRRLVSGCDPYFHARLQLLIGVLQGTAGVAPSR